MFDCFEYVIVEITELTLFRTSFSLTTRQFLEIRFIYARALSLANAARINHDKAFRVSQQVQKRCPFYQDKVIIMLVDVTV